MFNLGDLTADICRAGIRTDIALRSALQCDGTKEYRQRPTGAAENSKGRLLSEGRARIAGAPVSDFQVPRFPS